MCTRIQDGALTGSIRDFLGDPGVKDWSRNAADTGSIPGQGTNIPHPAGQLSLCATTREKLSTREKPVRCNEKIPRAATKS